MISPIPTNGDTIPPNRNPVAPKIADAAPIYPRPSSIANVVDAVNMNPKNTSMINVRSSYDANKSKAKYDTSCNIEITEIPVVPNIAALDIFLNFNDNAEPMPIPNALIPKITAKNNSENPKYSWIINDADEI